MIENQDLPQEDSGIIEGSTLTTHDLHKIYGLPYAEIASFQNVTYIYPNRAEIVHEGDPGKSMYLLRVGKVGIYKQVGRIQEKIDVIESVNFFGEMSLINEEPRSATVVALGKQVVVYKITSPNLHFILNYPTWVDLLVTRLSKNLAQRNDQLVKITARAVELQTERNQLRTELEQLRDSLNQNIQNLNLAMNGVLYFQTVVQRLTEFGSQSWAYLNVLSQFSRILVSHYMPNAQISEKVADIEVIRECLASMRNQEQGKDQILDDLNRTL